MSLFVSKLTTSNNYPRHLAGSKKGLSLDKSNDFGTIHEENGTSNYAVKIESNEENVNDI